MSGDRRRFDPEDPRFPLQKDTVARVREQLDESVAKQINETIATQQTRIAELRQELSELQTERAQLQQNVRSLTEQLASAKNQPETDRNLTNFEIADAFQRFGAAVEETQHTISEADGEYELGNVHVNLRANVLGDNDGIKLQFPGRSELQHSVTTSEFEFTLRPRPSDESTEYTDIPSVVGLEYEAAQRIIAEHGFQATVVERQPGDTPDTVLDQFPSPRSLAEPGTTIDLVVSEPASERTDTSSSAPDDHDHSGATDATTQLLAIRGIGQTYARRLREAGITELTDLVEAEPQTVAESANISVSRATTWIERANQAIRGE